MSHDQTSVEYEVSQALRRNQSLNQGVAAVVLIFFVVQLTGGKFDFGWLFVFVPILLLCRAQRTTLKLIQRLHVDPEEPAFSVGTNAGGAQPEE